MKRTVCTAVVGLTLACLLALLLGDRPPAALEVVALAAGAAVAFALAGGALMRRLGTSSLSVYLSATVLTTMLGIAAGTLLAGSLMFLSARDVRTVIVVLVAAGTVGSAGAIAMAVRLRDAVTTVSRLAATLGQRPSKEGAGQPVPTIELSTLADQLRQVGEQLHEAALRERTLEASRRELVAWISHDLRTPLAGIQAMTEALEDGVVSDPETVGRYYQTMRSEVSRLNGMVDDLFRLSRIHSGLITLNVELVSLSDLVSDAVALVKPVAEVKGVRLVGQVECEHPLVRLSTMEFLRILRNLLDNALRHTPPGGQVSLHAEASGQEAVVAVRDGCGGIPGSEIDRVFDLGYRGDPARSPGSGQRAGLGLAIAHGLATAHGGGIEVVNEEEGCCFSVRLPLPTTS
jgi:signal transduction histidine kinase